MNYIRVGTERGYLSFHVLRRTIINIAAIIKQAMEKYGWT
jgi:hypothetical protein